MFTEESFFMICKNIGLTVEEMDTMNIGQCLDYMQEWIDTHSKEDNTKTRKATQDDFNNF